MVWSQAGIFHQKSPGLKLSQMSQFERTCRRRQFAFQTPVQNFKFLSADAKYGALLSVVVPLHVPPHVPHHPHNLAPPGHNIIADRYLEIASCIELIKMPPPPRKQIQNIARGTTDPEIDSVTWIELGNNMAPLTLVANLTT